jgi:hypothetical protein
VTSAQKEVGSWPLTSVGDVRFQERKVVLSVCHSLCATEMNWHSNYAILD